MKVIKEWYNKLDEVENDEEFGTTPDIEYESNEALEKCISYIQEQ